MTTATPPRRTIQPTRGLGLLLTINGAANVVGGALLLPLGQVLNAPTGLPSGLLAGIGVFYLAYGAAMWFTATRRQPRAAAIVAVIAINPVWALGCLLVLITDLAQPTMLGSVLLATESVTVTGLAALQLPAYRRAGTPNRSVASKPLSRRPAAGTQRA